MKEDIKIFSGHLHRIAMVLGGIYAHGTEDQNLKAQRLNSCGFSNAEIAKILFLTPNAVGVALHRARKAGKRVKKVR